MVTQPRPAPLSMQLGTVDQRVAIRCPEALGASVQGTIQETGQDHGDAKKELAAVKEYDEKLKESCEAKAPSFEERETRRKAEIEGLQTALAILDGRDIAMTQLNRGLRR